MLFAVLSAVHANLAALEATLKAVATFRPQRTFVLGEVLSGGPQGAEVEALLGSTAGIDWVRAPAVAPTLLVRGERHVVLRAQVSDESFQEAGAIGRRVQAQALVLEGLERSVVERAGETLLIGSGVVGGVAEGDPRPSFALLLVDTEPKVRGWIERVEYDPSELLAAVDQASERGTIETKAAEKFLRSLLGREAGALPVLHRADRGSTALVKLLSPRIRDVYRRASEKNGLLEPEQVHLVRVATRRLRAALGFADPLMSPSAVRRTRTQLRSLGRALGGRRASDVMKAHLAMLAPQSDAEAAVVRQMERLNEARRRRTSRYITRDHDRPALIREGVELIGAMMCPIKDGPRLWSAVRGELELRAREVRASMDAFKRPDDDEGHHQLRIALKRLRYACEIVDPPFPELKAMVLAERIKLLQDALGDLHDKVELLHFVQSERVLRHAPPEGVATMSARLADERAARLIEAARRFNLDGAAILHDLDAALALLGSH